MLDLKGRHDPSFLFNDIPLVLSTFPRVGHRSINMTANEPPAGYVIREGTHRVSDLES